MLRPIHQTIAWVGKIDWEIRRFHGEEYSTHRGSTYNSYLVQDDKTALIDTVWSPFGKEFVEHLKNNFDLSKINYVIVNHGERDHSGALPELMRHIPDIPVYCTENAVTSLQGQYHCDWTFKTVKTGATLPLGKQDLIFIEAPMLHWPDSMFCYLTGANVLFSNDAFGQHLASQLLFNDLVDQAELEQECIKYYANILTPFSALVEKTIEQVLSLKVPVDMICPSHGVIWRKNPLQIVDKYREWAHNYQEDQITIVYDTMWDGTRRMAKAIARGLTEKDSRVSVKLFNIARSDKNDVITEVFKSKALLVGSPTINRRVLSSVGGLIEEVKGLGFKHKKAAAFGCYGWSGEGVKIITEELKGCGFEIINDGLRIHWNPDSSAIEDCMAFAYAVSESIEQDQKKA